MHRFLAAQAREPFDPGPMLILADAMEEVGDEAGAAALRGLAGAGVPSLVMLASLASLDGRVLYPDTAPGYRLPGSDEEGDGEGDGLVLGVHRMRNRGVYEKHGEGPGTGDGFGFGMESGLKPSGRGLGEGDFFCPLFGLGDGGIGVADWDWEYPDWYDRPHMGFLIGRSIISASALEVGHRDHPHRPGHP